MDHGPQILEKGLQQVRSLLNSGIHSQLLNDLSLAFIFYLQAGRNPQQARKIVLATSFDREFVLNLQQRLNTSFRDEAEILADQVNRHPALRQIPANRLLHFRFDVR